MCGTFSHIIPNCLPIYNENGDGVEFWNIYYLDEEGMPDEVKVNHVIALLHNQRYSDAYEVANGPMRKSERTVRIRAFVNAMNNVMTPEEVRLPSGLSAVKTQAFRGCRRLRLVTLPESDSVGLSAQTFAGCERLQALEHSELLTVVGKEAFAGCRSLREIRFGRDLRRIGERSFQNCRSLVQLSLPSCLETVGKRAFAGCWELAGLTLELGLEAMSPGMFRQCISLQEVELPDSLQELPSGVFRDCSAITALHIPGTVQRIGASAFRGCVSMETAVLSLGTAEIGAFAFAGNPALREVVIPHSLKRLGFGAFGLGRSKEKIVLLVDNEYMCRRLRRLLLFCGSAGRTEVRLNGKTLEERKRERHRSSLDGQSPHIS